MDGRKRAQQFKIIKKNRNDKLKSKFKDFIIKVLNQKKYNKMTQCITTKNSKFIEKFRINIKNLLFGVTVILSFATPTTVCGSSNSINSSSGSSSSSTTTSNSQNEQAQHIPLVRLPSNTLLKYTAYKDVSILHFRVPWDARTALFTFKAFEETKGAFRKYFLFIYLKKYI